MDSTMFWQIVVLVTYFLVLSTVLSVALCAYIVKMYPKIVAAMMEELDEDTSLDDHFAGTPDPQFLPTSRPSE